MGVVMTCQDAYSRTVAAHKRSTSPVYIEQGRRKTYRWIFANLNFYNVKYLAEYSGDKRFKIELAVQ